MIAKITFNSSLNHDRVQSSSIDDYQGGLGTLMTPSLHLLKLITTIQTVTSVLTSNQITIHTIFIIKIMIFFQVINIKI